MTHLKGLLWSAGGMAGEARIQRYARPVAVVEKMKKQAEKFFVFNLQGLGRPLECGPGGENP
jgi:hypothetical protein